MDTVNPYTAPEADLKLGRSAADTPPLWNPKAAAWWSLLFSPVFGAILHMKNWQALGEHEKAGQAMGWSVGMACILIVSSVLSMQSPAMGRVGNITGLFTMVLWFLVQARQQIAYVDGLGAFERRGWGLPVLSAIGAFSAFCVLVAILGLAGR